MNKVIIFIPVLLESQNKNNSTHWKKRHSDKNKIKEVVEKELQKISHLKFKKVIMHFQPILGLETEMKNGKKARNKTSRDITNNSPSVKFFEDMIVSAGILEDDTNDNVIQHVCYKSVKNKSFEGHGMLVMIEEVQEDYEVADCFKEFYSELEKEKHIDVKEFKKKRKQNKNKKTNVITDDDEINDIKKLFGL